MQWVPGRSFLRPGNEARRRSLLTLYQPMTHICVMSVRLFFRKSIRIYMEVIILGANTLYSVVCFFNPFTCVPAMERANDVTRSCLDLRLLPALPVAWLPPGQRHSSQVSWQPIQISVFLQIEAARPIYGYVQSPDFTPATSSPP